MLIYCEKTGKMIDPELKFQQSLKDAWAPLIALFEKNTKGPTTVPKSYLFTCNNDTHSVEKVLK